VKLEGAAESADLLTACRGRSGCGKENHESREFSRMDSRGFAWFV